MANKWLATNPIPTQHHGDMLCIVKGFGGKYGIKYGGTCDMQCVCVKDALRSNKHVIS